MSLAGKVTVVLAVLGALVLWVNLDLPIVRKSLISALHVIYVENGTINLNATTGELGITDEQPAWSSSQTGVALPNRVG